jgi:chemotaxis protein CheX
MNPNNLDLFIKAAEEIFVEIGFSNLKIINNQKENQKFDIIANIGITGEISGFLLIRSDLKSSMNFINKMLTNMGMDAEESDFGAFHKEAFGEILNQISGRAVMLLESNGIDSDITPPTILRGTNISMGTNSAAVVLHKTIEGSFGSFDILLGIKK